MATTFKLVVAFSFYLFVLDSQAAVVRDLSPIGPHVPILTLEKSENPQNLLVLFTRVDDKCQLAKVEGRPVLSQYWLMNRIAFKPVHPMIQQGIGRRVQLIYKTENASSLPSYQIRLNDLKEMNHDLGPSPTVLVKASSVGGLCAVETRLKLGPSNQNRVLEIASIYAKSKKTFSPPFRKIESLTLKGTDAETGESITRTYFAR